MTTNKIPFSKKIRDKYNGTWSSTLELIEDVYGIFLTTKLCCLVWWDCQTTKEKYDWSDVQYYINMYKLSYEDEFTIEELEKALIFLGYPKEKAIERAKPPKNINGKRRK